MNSAWSRVNVSFLNQFFMFYVVLQNKHILEQQLNEVMEECTKLKEKCTQFELQLRVTFIINIDNGIENQATSSR